MYPHPSDLTDDEPTMTDLRGVLPSQRPPVDRTVLEEPTSEVPVIKPRSDLPADTEAEAEAQLAAETEETETEESGEEAAEEPIEAAETVAAGPESGETPDADETTPLPVAPPPVVGAFGSAATAPVVDPPSPASEMAKLGWGPAPSAAPLTEPERLAEPEPNGWAPATEPADQTAGWSSPAPEPAGWSEPVVEEATEPEPAETGGTEAEPVAAETAVTYQGDLESEGEPEPEQVAEPEPEAVVEEEPEAVSEPVAVAEPQPYAVTDPEPVAEPAPVAVEQPAPASEPAAAPARRPGEVPEVPIALWSDEDANRLRAELRELQGTFFDDPAAAVAGAKRLVTDAVHTLADTLLAAQDQLDPYRDTDQVDTEAMRVAMRRYREFLERVLAL